MRTTRSDVVIAFSTAYDWALETILALDVRTPGLAGAYLRASDERRQVTCALLATLKSGAEDTNDVGELLLRGTHDAILRAAYGDVPRGLRGALSRSGQAAWGQDYYPLLYDVLSAPEHAMLTPLIQRLPKLTSPIVKIALVLPADLRVPRLLARMEHLEQATDLMAVTNLMEQAGLDRQTFIRALAATDQPSMSSVIERWALRLPFPPSPLPACDAYRPIRSGLELRRAAIRYRNCSRGYLPQALAGEIAFGEFQVNGEGVIVQLDRRNGIWTYVSANGFRNRPIRASIAEAAKSYAATYGVLSTLRRSRKADGWQALRRMGGLPRSW